MISISIDLCALNEGAGGGWSSPSAGGFVAKSDSFMNGSLGNALWSYLI